MTPPSVLKSARQGASTFSVKVFSSVPSQVWTLSPATVHAWNVPLSLSTHDPCHAFVLPSTSQVAQSGPALAGGLFAVGLGASVPPWVGSLSFLSPQATTNSSAT